MTKWIIGLALTGVAVTVAGCNQTGDAKQVDTASMATPATEREIVIPVEAERPIRGLISAYSETTSRIEAENRVEVTTKTSGTCVELNVEEGDHVKEGDVLAVLDQPEVKQALQAAKIQVPHQKVEYERAQKGFNLGFTPQAELDAARASYEQALSSVEQQQVQVDNLTIHAPIAGIVTARDVQLGQLVPAGHVVFSIVDPDSYMLTINVPEQELPRLKPGQVAQVNIDALGGKEYAATVRRVNPAVNRLDGTVQVILDFDKATRDHLVDAAFARARLVMETHDDALLVPKDAIVEENARKYLFVVRDEESSNDKGDETKATVAADTAKPDETGEPAAEGATEAIAQEETEHSVAERVEVQVGLEDKEHVEILSGITDDDLVITLGQHNLKSGSTVNVTNMQDLLMANAGMDADEALVKAQKEREEREKNQENQNTKMRRGRRIH